MHDNVELPEPPLTLELLSVHVRFVEFVATARVTVPVNPLVGLIDIVEIPGVPAKTDTLDGLAAIVKSAKAVTVTLTGVGVVVAPRGLPVTVRVKGPVGVEELVEIVRMLDPVGVTGFVAKLQVTPTGSGVMHDSVTGDAVPEVRVAVTVRVPELPCAMVTGPLFDNE